MAPISDVAANLLSAPAPLLLLDACALLDLIRAPVRRAPWQLPPALRLDALTATPSGPCQLLRASITAREFSDHSAEAQQQLEQYLQDLHDRTTELQQVFGLLLPPFTAPAFSPSPLPGALADLAQRLLARSTPLDQDPATHQRAYQRVLDKRRPSRRGEIKDAVMVEEYLELCRRLRAGGFPSSAVFLSSNTNDFCEGSARALHTELAADFTDAGLAFCKSWPEALQTLGM
jgi:hypothetical protein